MTRYGDYTVDPTFNVPVVATPPTEPSTPPTQQMGNSDNPLSRFLDDAYQQARRLFSDETPANPEPALVNVRKLNGFIPVSCCYLTDSTGTNHCKHPPRVVTPTPWTWRRARDRALGRWWDLREWLARKIAGRIWPDEEE